MGNLNSENRFVQIVKREGGDGLLSIGQDVNIHIAKYSAGSAAKLPEIQPERYGWLQVISGSVRIEDHTLKAGDALAVHPASDACGLAFDVTSDTTELLFMDVV